MRLTDEQLDWLGERLPEAPVSTKGGRPTIDLALWAGSGFGPTHTPPRTSAIACNTIIACWRHGVPVIAPRLPLGSWLESLGPMDRTLAFDATIPELVSALLDAAEPQALAGLRVGARAFGSRHAVTCTAWYERALAGTGPGPYSPGFLLNSVGAPTLT